MDILKPGTRIEWFGDSCVGLDGEVITSPLYKGTILRLETYICESPACPGEGTIERYEVKTSDGIVLVERWMINE